MAKSLALYDPNEKKIIKVGDKFVDKRGVTRTVCSVKIPSAPVPTIVYTQVEGATAKSALFNTALGLVFVTVED